METGKKLSWAQRIKNKLDKLVAVNGYVLDVLEMIEDAGISLSMTRQNLVTVRHYVMEHLESGCSDMLGCAKELIDAVVQINGEPDKVHIMGTSSEEMRDFVLMLDNAIRSENARLKSAFEALVAENDGEPLRKLLESREAKVPTLVYFDTTEGRALDALRCHKNGWEPPHPLSEYFKGSFAEGAFLVLPNSKEATLVSAWSSLACDDPTHMKKITRSVGYDLHRRRDFVA